MSEEEAIEISKDFIKVILHTREYETSKSKYTVTTYARAIEKLLDLYDKEKEKNKVIEIFRNDMPEDTEIVCMRKEDFERNFGNEYISKDKIKAKIKKIEKEIHVVTPDRPIIEKINECKNEGALNVLNELLEE